MITSLLGFKKGQTQMFTAQGKRIPVTLIQAGPCWITNIEDTPSYKSIQLGFGTTRHVSKAEEGHTKKAGLTNKLRFLRSFDVDDVRDVKPGSEIKVGDIFAVGDVIRITGTSKGKGFAGVVKRHGFAGGPRTHGQSDRERAPGSIGQTTTPGRVYRGKRMAGRMGSDRVTQRGLTVVAIDAYTNMLTIKGLVPGGQNGLLIIQKEKQSERAK
ncbi:50S ribosomal protein L3 [Candidatus Gottesmanbacteria bacterium]|nr:50S ribosomal protein L3 [Candidatus Gottesmanbacteria bacterium]